MNKREHLTNAGILGVGIGVMVEPSGGVETAKIATQVTVPLLLGALFPDSDNINEFGEHRKTFHNIFVVAFFYFFAYYFNNLDYVWIGVLTHFVLDFLGTKRGLGLFYPLSSWEYNAPVGVKVDSVWAPIVTLVITFLELGIYWFLVREGFLFEGMPGF